MEDSENITLGSLDRGWIVLKDTFSPVGRDTEVGDGGGRIMYYVIKIILGGCCER
jgi:hypothetical protein